MRMTNRTNNKLIQLEAPLKKQAYFKLKILDYQAWNVSLILKWYVKIVKIKKKKNSPLFFFFCIKNGKKWEIPIFVPKTMLGIPVHVFFTLRPKQW